MWLDNQSRKCLVEAFEKGQAPSVLAEIFHIRVTSVYHIVERAKKNGTTDLQTCHNGAKPKYTLADQENILKLVSSQPDITLQEIIDRLQLKISAPTVSRILARAGYTYKKKSLHATEQERLRCRSQKGFMAGNLKNGQH